jgi:hypothetical protein
MERMLQPTSTLRLPSASVWQRQRRVGVCLGERAAKVTSNVPGGV